MAKMVKMGKRGKMAEATDSIRPFNPEDVVKAPIIYINDPADSMPHAHYLADMIPVSTTVYLTNPDIPEGCGFKSCDLVASYIRNGAFTHSVAVIIDKLSDGETKYKIDNATVLRQEAIKNSTNFVSVNLFYDERTPADDFSKWGTNHIEMRIGKHSVAEVAERIFRTLFKLFSVKETLHLIPESEMLAIDTDNYGEYKYCPVGDSSKPQPNEKVQFVVLVLTKPVVTPDQKLTWTVVDRTGIANFYFQYRGESSQATWDWVLTFKPGERRILPRMEMVEVKERKTVRVVKAPFRVVGTVVSTTGLTLRQIGHGVAKLGELTKLGKSSKWVAKQDLVNGKKVNWTDAFKKEGQLKDAQLDEAIRNANAAAVKKTPVQIFNKTGQKIWEDTDSVASTAALSDEDGDDFVCVFDDEKPKEFC
ncbi:hypothetical protein KCU88_g2066, partial [Aureobasidium melanogenum]